MLVAQLLPVAPRPAPAPPRKAPGGAAAPAAHHPADSHAAHVPLAGDPDAQQTAALELALIRREQTFDVATKQRAEDERETNVLREMAMAQLKKDDENLKKWIAMI